MSSPDFGDQADGVTPAAAAPAAAPIASSNASPNWTGPATISPDDVTAAASAAGLDAGFYARVVHQESKGNARQVSPRGAIGGSQLMPDTARSLGVNPYDTLDNLKGGATYLKSLLDRYGGDQKLAAAAYNAGPNAVDKYNGVPPFKETQGYVSNVAGTPDFGGMVDKAPTTNAAQPSPADAPTPTAPVAPAAPNAKPYYDNGANVTRLPDGTVVGVGDTTDGGETPSAPGQPVVINISGSSNPDAIAAWLKAHPNDPGNKPTAIPTAPLAGQSTVDRLGIGADQGLANVGTSADQFQKWIVDHAPGGQVADRGLSNLFGFPTADQAVSNDLITRHRNDAQYAGSNAYGVGKFAGEVAPTLPLMAMTGGAAGYGVGALTDAAPELTGAARFLGGGTQGGILGARGASLATRGALQGAEAGAYTSGGSDNPFFSQVGHGAAAGAVLGYGMPAAAASIRSMTGGMRGAAAVVNNAFLPLTEAGRGQIADNIIRRFAADGPTSVNSAELVPGSTPTLAQATGNPGIASMERAVRDVRPNQFIASDQTNAAARISALGKIAGTPESIEELQAARDGTALPMLHGALGNAGPADASPVVDQIDQILASPAGQRDAVVSNLKNLRAKLVDSNGNVQSDAAQLYGIRQSIGDALSPLAARSGSNAQLATHELMQVKGGLDSAIEDAAPGYKDYLSTYARMSGPANAQSYLQGLNLTDAQGNVTLAKVKGALDAIGKKQNLPGTNDAKSVSPEQVGSLQAMYDDLQRASNSGLGKSIGSNTFQNLATNNLMAQGGAPLAAAGAILGHHPLLAPLAYGGRLIYSAKNGAILDALTDRLTNPELGSASLGPVPAGNPYFTSPAAHAAIQGANDNLIRAGAIGYDAQDKARNLYLQNR